MMDIVFIIVAAVGMVWVTMDCVAGWKRWKEADRQSDKRLNITG